jgi:hypothetical protein
MRINVNTSHKLINGHIPNNYWQFYFIEKLNMKVDFIMSRASRLMSKNKRGKHEDCRAWSVETSRALGSREEHKPCECL